MRPQVLVPFDKRQADLILREGEGRARRLHSVDRGRVRDGEEQLTLRDGK